MLKNNIPLFFIFQFLFFGAAIVLGNWYSKNGLKAWGLPISKKIMRFIILGTILGIIIYSIPYFLSILFGIEKVVEIPPIRIILQNSLPFAIGVLFTSFSEDILTRGLIYTYLNEKIKPVYLIIVSASIYLLNHIYRLSDGLDVLIYLFLLGIIFFIPLLNSKNLWITGSMHWAGNVYFFISQNVIQTQEIKSIISYNYLFSGTLIFMIPLIWILTKRFQLNATLYNNHNSPNRYFSKENN